MASMVELVNSIVIDAELLPGSVEAVVTPVNGSAVTVSALWVSQDTFEFPDADFRRRGEMKLLAVQKSDVPSAPRKTTVAAPSVAGGASKNWRVESLFDDERSGYRVLVLIET